MGASVLAVNLAELRELRLGSKTVRSGIFKLTVEGPVAVRRDGLEGDVQADRRVHGGPDQAVYAYAREDADWWQGALGRELENGFFGENLTLRGLDASGAVVGERWRAGSSLLEVTAPRVPCAKLAAKVGDPRFVKRFGAANRPGAYLRVIEEGQVAAGDPVEVVSGPGHGITVALVHRALLGQGELAPRLLEAPQLPAKVLRWAERKSAELAGAAPS